MQYIADLVASGDKRAIERSLLQIHVEQIARCRAMKAAVRTRIRWRA